MSLVINEDKCARCGECEPVCPNEAIFQTEDAYRIDPALCNECVRFGDPQCITVCPNEGIHKTKDSLLSKCMSLFG